MKQKLLGAAHPDVGLTLAILAVIQKSGGRVVEADSCCRRALAILEESLGSAHPRTVVCRDNYVKLRALLPGG